jgi:hypothetical protein
VVEVDYPAGIDQQNPQFIVVNPQERGTLAGRFINIVINTESG